MIETIHIPISKTKDSRLASTDFSNLPFGKRFSDHMFTADYKDGEWQNFQIIPYQPISFHPALASLHYGQAIFEGMKAFKNIQGEAVIFRPLKNLERLNKSAERMCMPTISEELFMAALQQLIALDKDWIPTSKDSSLYIRPFMFASDEVIGVSPSKTYKFIIFTCPSGPYFSQPIKVKIETDYARSCPGGVGFAKVAGNYGSAMLPTQKAKDEGFDQVLWTDANNHEYFEESGTTNVMFMVDGKLLTPPTRDTILKGVTRDSVLGLAREWGITVEERRVSVTEIIEAIKNGTLTEAFGIGTAAVVVHIEQIGYKGNIYTLPNPKTRDFSNKVYQAMDDIKLGKAEDKLGWMYKI